MYLTKSTNYEVDLYGQKREITHLQGRNVKIIWDYVEKWFRIRKKICDSY
jgi:hypothetical protein